MIPEGALAADGGRRIRRPLALRCARAERNVGTPRARLGISTGDGFSAWWPVSAPLWSDGVFDGGSMRDAGPSYRWDR